RIERLPILNVDPELTAWGSEVANRLKEAAGVFNVGQLSTHARTQGVLDAGVSNYDEAQPSDNVNRENAERERRKAGYEEKAAATEKAMSILAGLNAGKNDLRQRMTQK